MPHWKEIDPNQGPAVCVGFSCKLRLWLWIEQTRGKKSRSLFIREILTEAMKNG